MGIPKGGIAFFDSGIGGLTVLAECKKLFPDDLFYYYGDNGNAPYGNLPPHKIKKYVERVFRKFQKLQVRAVVLACNTVTALCVEELRNKYSFPIVGAEPALFVGARRGGKVLVLSTKATFDSPRFQTLLRRAKGEFPSVKLYAYPCEGLAGEIETRLFDGGWDFTHSLPRYDPDVVVLGCTHYIYIVEQIRAYYHCQVVDGNRGIALRLLSQCPPSAHSQPPSPQKNLPVVLKKKKRGVLSLKNGNNKRGIPSPVFENIYFLGGYANHNFKIYEQMFGLKVVKKG